MRCVRRSPRGEEVRTSGSAISTRCRPTRTRRSWPQSVGLRFIGRPVRWAPQLDTFRRMAKQWEKVRGWLDKHPGEHTYGAVAEGALGHTAADGGNGVAS